MRIKVERKIASSETMSVRKVNGKGSTCGMPGTTFNRIQLPNQRTCTHTKVMLPQKFAIFSARRSVGVRCLLAASSSRVTVSTFCSVNCSADGTADPFPFEIRAVLVLFVIYSAFSRTQTNQFELKSASCREEASPMP